jgi:hypothetical protein
MSSVFLLIADDAYAPKAQLTIMEARTHGKWTGDIVWMTTPGVMNNEEYRSMADSWNVEMIPLYNIQSSLWNHLPDGCEWKKYAQLRPNVYTKLGMMSVVFKKWDTVLYVDAGTRIFGPLSRLIEAVASAPGFLYAHSDSYPTYVWKLSIQFDTGLLDETSRDVFLQTFDTDRDYFQSTVMLYSTSIIEDSTMDDLVDLLHKWPISRGDQGIFNLYFNCMKGLWRPLPIRDDQGFLYDFLERDHHSFHEYVMLKYPTTVRRKKF